MDFKRRSLQPAHVLGRGRRGHMDFDGLVLPDSGMAAEVIMDPKLQYAIHNAQVSLGGEGREMTLKQFIKANRQELDACILRVVPGVRLNDAERRLWILNDEGLYRWARSEGVKI